MLLQEKSSKNRLFHFKICDPKIDADSDYRADLAYELSKISKLVDLDYCSIEAEGQAPVVKVRTLRVLRQGVMLNSIGSSTAVIHSHRAKCNSRICCKADVPCHDIKRQGWQKRSCKLPHREIYLGDNTAMPNIRNILDCFIF